jgi:hypothetical protein
MASPVPSNRGRGLRGRAIRYMASLGSAISLLSLARWAISSPVNGSKSDFPARLKFPYFAVANISTTYACRAVARSR